MKVGNTPCIVAYTSTVTDLFTMHPSLRRAHQPLIKFLGRRTSPSTHMPPRPHSLAPPVFKRFTDVVKKPGSSLVSETRAGGREVFGEFWEAPSRYWSPRGRDLEETEIDAVLSGGASYR